MSWKEADVIAKAMVDTAKILAYAYIFKYNPVLARDFKRFLEGSI
jgi:hypothetical protein